MPRTPEPRPDPATDRCPPRYRTRRQAQRGAWWLADRAGTKPLLPMHCDNCGGWHVAKLATRPITTGAP